MSIWHLPDTIWNLPDTISYFPDTIWHLPDTILYLPDTLFHSEQKQPNVPTQNRNSSTLLSRCVQAVWSCSTACSGGSSPSTTCTDTYMKVSHPSHGWQLSEITDSSGYGVRSDGKVLFINASTCDTNYLPCNPPVVFDVPKPLSHSS